MRGGGVGIDGDAEELWTVLGQYVARLATPTGGEIALVTGKDHAHVRIDAEEPGGKELGDELALSVPGRHEDHEARDATDSQVNETAVQQRQVRRESEPARRHSPSEGRRSTQQIRR